MAMAFFTMSFVFAIAKRGVQESESKTGYQAIQVRAVGITASQGCCQLSTGCKSHPQGDTTLAAQRRWLWSRNMRD